MDTPETDDDFPERVADQAGYFGISSKRATEIGQAAARFSARTLADHFTVITRWEDARGRSKLPRHYAFIIANGRSLADQLIENGLARVFGEKAISPDGTATKTQQLKLFALEHQAKTRHAGGWSSDVAVNLSHRLFVPSGERHNTRCPFFSAPNTRPCASDEGKACHVCGG